MQHAQNKAKLCMRMQPTAQALLCTAKHDWTMTALLTGHSSMNGKAADQIDMTQTI